MADITIILDASGSVKHNFETMKDFAKAFVSHYTIGWDNVRTSLVRFSQTAVTQWTFSDAMGNREVEFAIDGVEMIGGTTNVAAALRVCYVIGNIFIIQGMICNCIEA